MTKINRVAIVGGTHGNEYTGVYLYRHWERNREDVTRGSFDTELFFGNPRAFELNRRFVDQDLNRSFNAADLQNPGLSSYEAQRAKVLNALIGPKGSPRIDFVIDLHTTTANTGLVLFLFKPAPFTFQVAAYVQSRVPQTKIYHLDVQESDQSFLASVCEYGLAVEIGPIPQGVVRQDALELTRKAVYQSLDAIDKHNRGEDLLLPPSIDYYRHTGTVPFPTRGDWMDATIHESLQDRDFQPLRPGDPVFRKLDGESIGFDGQQIVYPVLINEAAYYDGKVAFFVSEKVSITIELIPSHVVQQGADDQTA